MDMKRSLALEQTLFNELTRLVEADPSASVFEVCNSCELRIVEGVRLAVLDQVCTLAKRNRKAFVSFPPNFGYGNTDYCLTVADNPFLPHALSIVIHCIDPAMGEVLNQQVIPRLDSVGRYREVHVCVGEAFRPGIEDIAEAAQTVLEAGYRWLAVFVLEALGRMHEKSASRELHRLLRTLLPEQLASNVWPYCIVDGEGFYALDNIAQRKALANCAVRRLDTRWSPLDLVSSFSASHLDRTSTFSNIALTANTTIEREFVKAPYRQTGLHIPEEAIYASPGHVLQPLVTQGRTQLAVGYPIDLRSDIEPVLERGRQDIKRVMDAQSSALRRTIQRIKEQGSPATGRTFARVGAFAGAFWGEFFREWTVHYWNQDGEG